VLRGKWVLDNILNTPPPAKPAGVPDLDETAVGVSASLREQLQQHRANAVCASCHSRMDPLGFALENYDAIGQWRDKDGKFPIDASGQLPDGRKFVGAKGLADILMSDPNAFAKAITEKMLIYALGRGLETYDRPAVNQIVAGLAANQYRFSSLVLGIVNSVPFEQKNVAHWAPSGHLRAAFTLPRNPRALWGSQSWLQPAFSRLASSRASLVSAARDAPVRDRLSLM
jgi:hypothetical protein